MDNQGYLHVLAGTHGRPFPYACSLQPNTAHAGWTEPAPAGEGLGQTYIGLVCGPDGTLHSVFRLWRSGVEPFPASSHATLAYQRKRPGQPWEPPRVLVVAPFSEYSVFYHRLTIDRKGRLFLSYDYWSTYWFYRNDHFGNRRALLMSPDGGDTWKLADSADLNSTLERTRADIDGHSAFPLSDRDGCAWLVKPDGTRFFSLGVCVVDQGASRETLSPTNPAYAAFQHHKDSDHWAPATLARLQSWNFTTIGGWSDFRALRRCRDVEMAFTPVLHAGSTAGCALVGHVGGNQIARMHQIAREQVLPLKDDARVLGYYIDNEMGSARADRVDWRRTFTLRKSL